MNEIQKLKSLVTILLPCYNEEEAVAEVISNIKTVMNETDYNYEIMVVNDASTDRTKEIIGKIEDIKIINRIVHGGSGAARKTGILNAAGEIIVTLDADGTYEVKDIPELLKYFPEYDQVNGARDKEQGTYKLFRITAKWIIRMIACYLSGVKIPDLNTGLKAFKKEILLKYLWAVPDGFSCVSTMTLVFLCNGYYVKYIPTKYYARIGKSKFHPIKDTYKYIETVFRMIVYFNPLRIFLPLGLLFVLGGLIKGLLNKYLFSSEFHTSNIFFILAGLLILLFGLIADLIVAQNKKNSSG